MGTPYLSEIRMMSFNFAPRGWALCNGQIMAIQQNQALFALIGTTYGGNGTQTFALPNLQGRVPMHFGSGYVQGQASGEETHTLVLSELPAHNHTIVTNPTADQKNPSGHYPATSDNTQGLMYAGAGSGSITMAGAAILANGGSAAHPNMQPYLVTTFCMALNGAFPSRN